LEHHTLWGTLDIVDGAILTLFGDAIYLDTLVLGAGSTLHLNGVNLYYDTFIDNGGSYDGGNIFFLANDQNSGGDHVVPEPATMLLFGGGMLGAFLRRRRIKA